MATRFFYKEGFSNAYLVEGAPVQFEQLEGNCGVLMLDTEKDSKLIAALDKAAEKSKGGIVRINGSDYEAKKKQVLPPRLNVPSRQRDEIRVMPRDLNPQTAKAAETAKPDVTTGPDGLPLYDKAGLRLDGPTKEQWVAAGMQADGYPPKGYAVRTIPRWKEAGLAKDPDADEPETASSPSIPRPDTSDKKEQGQGAPPPPTPGEKKDEGQPAFKPATKRVGEPEGAAKMTEPEKQKAPKPGKPTTPPPPPAATTEKPFHGTGAE